MIREARLLFLVALTYLIYAASMFLDKGGILFPFPLNEAILLIVALQFAYWNRSQQFSAVNLILIGLFGVGMNLLYWEMVLPPDDMYAFSESLWTDFFNLLFGAWVLIFGIRTVIKQNSLLSYALGIVFVGFFITGLIYYSPLHYTPFYTLAYAVMVISTSLRPAYAPLHLYWVLLFMLEGFRILTFGVNT
jgi:hypothetical protein